MSDFTCGICGEDWAVRIPNTVQGGQIQLCASHRDYLQEIQTQALSKLLEENK